MYAILEDSGTQMKVSEGDVMRVATRNLPADAATLTFDRILLVGKGDGGVQIGAPYVVNASVTADILSEDSEKYRIYKLKKRKNYRRKTGHRQHFLKVKITSIQA